MKRQPDFARYSLRPERGGWVTRCKSCSREKHLPSVDKAAGWQWNHTCSAAAISATTIRDARWLLALMTPDDARVVMKRRADALAEVARWKAAA